MKLTAHAVRAIGRRFAIASQQPAALVAFGKRIAELVAGCDSVQGAGARAQFCCGTSAGAAGCSGCGLEPLAIAYHERAPRRFPGRGDAHAGSGRVA